MSPQLIVGYTIGSAKSRHEAFQLRINIELHRQSVKICGGVVFLVDAQIDNVREQGPLAFSGCQYAHNSAVKVFQYVSERNIDVIACGSRPFNPRSPGDTAVIVLQQIKLGRPTTFFATLKAFAPAPPATHRQPPQRVVACRLRWRV